MSASTLPSGLGPGGCSKQHKRLLHGQKPLAWTHEGYCRFKSHVWVLLAQSGQEILQTCQFSCVTSFLLEVYALFIQAYLYCILFPFLFNLFIYFIWIVSLSPLFQRMHCHFTTAEKKCEFFKSKEKKSYFNLFFEYYDDRNHHQQPTSQEDQLLPQSSPLPLIFLFLFYILIYFYKSFLLQPSVLYKHTFFIPSGSCCGVGMYFCLLGVWNCVRSNAWYGVKRQLGGY